MENYVIPAPKTPSQSEHDTSLAAGVCMQQECQRLDISEEEMLADFHEWRVARRLSQPK
jgi:hypothetical protein